ncbi:MAG: hypothetical protein ABJK39_05430 [Hyphomicrobiales bacterium]
MISKILQKIPIVRLVSFKGLCERREFERAVKYYESKKFGTKYQVLADLFYASALGELKDYNRAIEQLGECSENLETNKYFNDDTVLFLNNYISTNRSKFRNLKLHQDADPVESLNMKLRVCNVPKYIRSFFYHGAVY